MAEDRAGVNKAIEEAELSSTREQKTVETSAAKTAEQKLRNIGDRYEVIDELGQGGMGSVLKARHKALGKTVAIKVLNAALLSDETFWKRFEREAKAGASLAHPNLVSVFDYGLTDEQEPYLVMDYLEGYSLDKQLKKAGKLKESDFFHIFTQVLRALQYLHGKNVIHRDLKPNNIMVQVIGDEEYAKLIDLGIAKVFPEDGKAVTELTSTGTIMGSPLYMSPEQCKGLKADARSDLYSLGCVMYECLACKPPLKGANELQTLYMQLNDDPEPLKCETQMERDLWAVIKKCLEKSPSARYQTAQELLAAVNALNPAGVKATAPQPRAKGSVPQQAGAPAKKAPPKVVTARTNENAWYTNPVAWLTIIGTVLALYNLVPQYIGSIDKANQIGHPEIPKGLIDQVNKDSNPFHTQK